MGEAEGAGRAAPAMGQRQGAVSSRGEDTAYTRGGPHGCPGGATRLAGPAAVRERACWGWPPLRLRLQGRAGRAEPCCRSRSLEAEQPKAPALLLAQPPLPGTADTLAPSRPVPRATAAQEGSQPGAGDTCSHPQSSPCASRCGRPCSAHARLSPTHAWAAATQEMEVRRGGPAPHLASAQGRVPARTSWALGPDLARPPCVPAHGVVSLPRH